MGPMGYQNPEAHNEDMEARYRTGISYIPHRRHTDSRPYHADPPLSFGGGPGFRGGQTLRQGSTPMEDTLFEINQTGLSPMWYASILFLFHAEG